MDTPLAKSGNSVETNLISYLDLFLKADQNSHFSIDRNTQSNLTTDLISEEVMMI